MFYTEQTPITPCRKQVSESMNVPFTTGRFVPRCSRDGTFEEVQCSEWSGECWCVNLNGAEIEGTRSKNLVTCSGQRKYIVAHAYKKVLIYNTIRSLQSAERFFFTINDVMKLIPQ